MKKPEKSFYGYEDRNIGADGEGGWVIEGGEEAYEAAIIEYATYLKNQQKFTKDDLINCWGDHVLDYLLQILNDEYDLQSAKLDLKSLIGSKYDKRLL